MSLITGNCVENNNLKFVELRKYVVSDETNGVNCVAIDNNYENVFLANHNHLKVISISHLLDFTWNKSIINEFVEQFDHFTIIVAVDIHFISISGKGFGTKLAVCQQLSNAQSSDSPFIELFDLKSVYDHRSKSGCYNRLNLINSNGYVTDMIWHPEMCDNNFACRVSDGSIFILSIGDMDSRTATILEYLPSTLNCLSMCWSPKGKQIAITFNGYFSQYKLINGQHVQEYKKIILPNDFHDYSIIAVKWITSSLFVIACCKQIDNNEKDTHIFLISTPTKGSPTFIDFGNIFIDNYDVIDSYRVYLLHYENMVICSTNVSSEVSIIGCNSNELSSPNNWCQWMLDDNSRIDLPLDRDGNESYLRGFAIAKGTEKAFQISATEVYGGVMCPILVTYLSSGIVLPYLIVKRNGSFKSIEPPNITKPVINAIGQNVNVNVAQTKPQSTQKSSIYPNSNTGFSAVVSSSPITSASLTSDTIRTNASTKKQISMPSAVRKSDTQTQQIDNESSLPDNSAFKSINQNQFEPKAETVTIPKNLFLDAINEQINEFNKLFSVAKEKFAKIQTKIGDKSEYTKLKMDTRLIEEVLSELKENFSNFSRDTTTLQSSLIELFSLLEEAKSIMNRNVDPRYRHLLRQRALDPITARHMEEIKKVNQYIELQLRELDAKLEQEWLEWLEKRKLKTSPQLSRVHSFSNLELVYKTLANNQKVINNLRMNLEKLHSLLPKVNKHNRIAISDNSKNNSEIESLAQALKKNILKDNDLINEPINQSVFKIKVISKEKRLKLKEFLENRTNVPVRRSVDFFNDSSRFISTIELIKEKSQKQNISSDSNSSAHTLSVTNETNSPKTQSLENPALINSEDKVFLKKDKPLTLPIQKLDLKLGSPSFSFAPKDNIKQNSLSFKPTVKSDDSQVTSKSFAVVNADKPVCLKPSKPVSIVKTKTTAETVRNEQALSEPTATSVTTNLSKTVSFGDTTIINPAKVLTDDSIFKANLSTISESSENTETMFGTNISALPKFNYDPNTTQPTLSFNLNFPNSYNLFTKKDDNVVSTQSNKTNDDLPKYEDITPPSTPQIVGSTQTKKDDNEIIISNTASSETILSEKNSILSTTLSGNLFKQTNENNVPKASDKNAISSDGQNTNLTPVLTNKSSDLVSSTMVSKVMADTSTVASNTVPDTVSSVNESSKSNSLTTSTSSSVFGNSVSNQSEQISSAFSEQKAIQTPFASNSFTFGNQSSLSSTKPVSPTFSQALSFGQSSAATTTSFDANPLTFGQQSEQALNNLSFCSLGGQPTAENANKNVFGSSFSNSVSQSSPFFSRQTVSTTQQSSSPFSSANNSTSGSFTAGGAGVAQTGFGSFQQTSPQQSGGAVFGGSAMFGSAQKPAFGSSPSFGSSPPSFGSAPTFGGSPVLGATTFGSQQTNNSFGAGFGNTSNSSLSFGALASSAPQTNQNVSPFGSQIYNSSANVFGAANQSQGFSFGGSANTDSFTQRRK